MWLIGSAKRGFTSEVQIRPGQAKKFADLISRAESAGGIVTVVPKGQKREFSVKATGTAMFKGGPRVGSSAEAAFIAAGGKVTGSGIKARGSLPAGVKASQFGIMKLTSTVGATKIGKNFVGGKSTFRNRKKKFGEV